MALIDYPNVPLAPGVPNVRRSIIGIASLGGLIGQIENLDQFGILGRIVGPQWGVLDKDGNFAIQPDTVVSFRYRGEEKIATHPVELGSFSSYNKVTIPYDIQMVFACNGQGSMTRPEILGRIQELKESTEIFDIVTPDFAYLDVNLVSCDYSRKSSQGVSMLLIDLRFQEVRTTARVTYPETAEPAGASPVSTGAVKSQDLSDNEDSAYLGGLFS